jgi:uncharacterized membrane protein YraQ (UPF0718 family)
MIAAWASTRTSNSSSQHDGRSEPIIHPLKELYMAIARGLTRLWIVLTIIHMIVVGIASVAIFYEFKEEQRRVEAEIAENEKNPNAKPKHGYYYGSPEKRLEEIHWRREQMVWAVPLIAVGPPIAIYCLAAALVWAVAGFKPEPPGSGP